MGFFRGLLISFCKGAAFVVGGASAALLAVTVSGMNQFRGGDLISAGAVNANFTALKTAIEGVPDHVAAKGAGNQNIPHGGLHAIVFSSEVFDTDDMLTAGNDRITIQSAGYYLIVTELDFNSNAAGQRFLRHYVNGGQVQEFGDDPYSSTNTHLGGSGIMYLNAGDYVQILAEQASGVTLNAGGTLAVVKLAN